MICKINVKNIPVSNQNKLARPFFREKDRDCGTSFFTLVLRVKLKKIISRSDANGDDLQYEFTGGFLLKNGNLFKCNSNIDKSIYNILTICFLMLRFIKHTGRIFL